MLLDLPRDHHDVILHSVAGFRLRVHTLRFETATLNSTSSPTCDLCETDDDVQDKKHVLFRCTHPQILFAGITRYYFHRQDCTRKATYSILNLLLNIINRRAVMLLDCRPFFL